MKKQYVFCRMALLLCAWLFSFAAYAEIETGICGSDLTWTLNTETGVLEISGTGEMFNYSNEYSSSGSAPWYNRPVKTVIIGDGVTSIGDYAFYWRYIGRVVIGKQVATIGKGAFQGCPLSSVTIPGNVKVIGDAAFAHDMFNEPYYDLAQITIEDGVVSIGNRAFWGNNELTAVTIPQSVTTIGDEAFSDCKNLKSVTIQGNLQHLGRKAFPYKTLDIITGDIVSDGRCIIIGDTLKAFASKGAIQYSIPDDEGIAFIGDYAFEECTDLQSVEIPQGVTAIGEGAFSGCTGLEKVTISQGVTAIGSSAFSNCTGLTEITIPNGVTALGDKVFYRCTHLQSVTIPNSMESIGDEVFSDCTDLETFEGKFASADHRCLVVNDTLKYFAPKNLTRYTIPDDVTVIEKAAFSGGVQKKTLVEITIPRSVVTIEYGAFSGCPYLKEVWFNADSCISGGGLSGIFGSALTAVHIGENVKRIPDYAFYGCRDLTSITIPESVTTIGDRAFLSCGLTEVWFNADSCIISGDYYGIFGSALTAVHIGENVKRIPGYAFSGCEGLTSITIPESVTTIGGAAFEGCSGLTSVTIPKSVTSIGLNAFYYCNNLREVWFNADSCICVSESGGFGIFGPALTAIHIGENVKQIPAFAFSGCEGLTSITIPESVRTIGNVAFQCCTGLTSVTIPESVMTIDGTAFLGCSNLSRFEGKWASLDNRCLVINDTLKTFAPSGLSEYTIPDGVTTIGGWAFYDCTGLTSITIPKSVTSIGFNAFYGCNNLTSVTVYNTTPPEIYYESFSDIAREDTLYVPSGSVDKYRYDYAWNNSFSEILPIEGYVPEAEKDFEPSDITPDNGAEVTALKTFTLIFTEKPALAAEAQPITLAGKDTLLTATLAVGDGNTLAITLADTLKTAGEYTLTIPESTFGDAAFAADPTTGRCNPELTYTYYVVEDTVPDEPVKPETVQDFKPSGITPTDSSEVEALKTFTLEFAEKPSLAAEAQPITLAGNDTLLTATLSVGSGNTLAITLADTLKTVGEYTLTIPEGAFGDADFAADPTVGHCNPELVYTYTIKEPEPVEPDEPENPDKPDEPIVPDEPSSITETQADAGHITVYNLQGVLVLETNDAADLKTLQSGAYIVNGKKMIIAR